MTRDEFLALAAKQGYGPPKTASFEPNSKSAVHQHDQISFVYVVEGDFILNTPEGANPYRPGETCILDKDIDHAEEAGPCGATIMVVRK